MAFTVSTLSNGAPGNVRIWSGTVVATNITGVATIPGATQVDAILSFVPISTAACAAGQVPVIAMNVNASGVTQLGAVGFSNIVSSTGATYLLTVLYH